MLIQQICSIFSKFKKSNHIAAYLLSTKSQKRILYITLLLITELSQIATPFAYAAQSQTPPPLPAEKKSPTLLTETTSTGALPLLGVGSGVKSIIPSFTNTATSNLSAREQVPAKVHKLLKANYRPNEEIAVVIDNGADDKYQTQLVDTNGAKIAVETEESVTGDTKTITVSQPSNFRPGKYKLRITNTSGGVSEQDFTWGVLAINPDKSVYTPGETADLAIAVLNEKGDMVCDASVVLDITDPTGKKTTLSTDNKKISVNPECLSHDFTLKPDYETNYQTDRVGTYKMDLQAKTQNGSYSISDSFDARATVPFDVKRVTATRIYPPHTYPVTMEITANQDFNGSVTETVPAVFQVAKPGQTISSTNQFNPDPTASNAAAPSDIQAPEVAPSASPSDGVITAFNTINNLTSLSGTSAVLGASVPGLGMPFSGNYPVTQEFGDSLVHVHDESLYKEFGMQGHDGIDFGVPIGTQIQSVDAGTVTLAGPGDYGTTVVVQHSWGKSYYGHLSRVDVKLGDQVLRGSLLGLSGNSGITTGPHLHFGIKPNDPDVKNGYYGKVDPAYYLGLKQSASNVLGASTKAEDAILASAVPAPAQTTISTPVSTDVQILTWKINVKKGDKIKIGYNYLAPRISPQFYTLGPATFHDTAGNDVFREQRKWQIAADAMDLKMKKGTFVKSISSACAQPCVQSVTGLGFKPKAVIFTWTKQIASGNAVDDNHFGMGFSSSTTQERAVSVWNESGSGTSDSGYMRSDSKSIVIQGDNGAVNSKAELLSFDTDGFTINWSTQDNTANIIQYQAIGGADVTNVKAGTFTLASSGATQAVTDPGFRPDFVMFLAGGRGAVDTNFPTASISAGFASSPTQEASTAILSEDNNASNADTCRQQRTDASILLLIQDGTGAGNCATQDAIADLASFDTSGFTLNVTDTPAANTDIYYLAIQGGQYKVGSFTQKTDVDGEQAVTSVGFRPSGVALMSTGLTTAQGTGVVADMKWSFGGASGDHNTISQAMITVHDNEAATTEETAVGNDTTSAIRFLDISGASITVEAQASVSSLDPSGFTLNWARDGTAREIIYWAAGSANATQEDYRWYKNTNSLTPSSAMEDENQPATIAQNRPYARLRTSISTSGNGLNASAQGFKLQYASAQGPAASSPTSDWCNATTGVTCIAPSTPTASTSATSWPFRRKITFNNSASSSNLDSFPVLVKLDSTRIDYNKVQSGGQDLRFVDPSNNTTVLPYEIESWDPAGTSYVWVQVPRIDSGSTTDYIWMYYGNSSAASGQSASSVWSTNYAAVWHMKEDPSGTAPQMSDSSGNSHNGTSNGSMVTANQVAGKIDGSLSFDGVNDYINTGDISQIDNVSHATVSMWMKRNAAGGFVLATKETGSNIFGIQAWSDGNIYLEQTFDGTTDEGFFASNDTNWHLVTEVFDGTQATNATRLVAYLDGVPQTLSFNGTIPATTPSNTTAFIIGRDGIGGTNFTNGQTDEVRISAQSLTADWVKAEYLTATDAMNSLGQEQEYTSAGTSDSGWVDVADSWCNAVSGVTCNTNWTNRRKITLAAASSTTLDNFPVLVKLDSTRIDYSKTQNSGQDIRFVDPSDPTTVLPHQIELWNESGSSYVWVKVPHLKSGPASGYLLMYYGNASASDGQASTSVWDSNFVGIYHLNEGAVSTINDSTGVNNGTKLGTTTPAAYSSGQVDGAQDFSANDYINIPNSASLQDITEANYTYAAWVNPDTLPGSNDYFIVGKKGNTTGLRYANDGSGNGKYYLTIYDNTTSYGVQSKIMPIGTWAYVAMTVDTATKTVSLYVNGVLQGTNTYTGTLRDYTTQASSIGKADIAGSCATSFVWCMDGKIDEVRMSNTNRSADWLRAEYLTEADLMNTFGSEESQTSSAWRFKDNPSPTATDGATLTSGVLSTSTSGDQETYQESNSLPFNSTAIAAGEKREWDFSLDGTNARRFGTYYFRIVSADGTPLTNYTRYPTLTMGPSLAQMMRNGKWFSYGRSQPFTF